MAGNRLVLRDLQARLAERMAQAKEGAGVSGWLALEVGTHGYLVSLTHAGEIFPVSTVQTVPYTQPWFWGVANLRGGLYGVVDTHHFLFGHPAAGRTEFTRNASRFVAFNSALDLNVVLLVDRMAGLRNVQSFVNQIEPEGERPAFFAQVLVDAQGRHWQELDLQKLSQDAHFLSVAAASQATPVH